jgi:oligosaccharyltransferase complex subunit alpha (ribophorin I)
VKYSVPVPIEKEERYLHKTFMDTIGRTAIKLTLSNVVDEQHHKELIVTYHLDKTAGLRKPFVMFTALSTLFVISWIISKIDTRIGK